MAAKGDQDVGYALIADGLKTTIQLRTDPTLISQLVNIADTNICINTLNSMIRENGISTGSAQNLLELFNQIDFNKFMFSALNGEMVIGRDIIEGLINGKYLPQRILLEPKDKIPKTLFYIVHQSWPLFYQDYNFYLKKMTEIRELFCMPYWEAKDKMKNWDVSLKSPTLHILTRRLTPALTSCRTRTAHMESDIAGMKLTLALYIYKNEHGSFPDMLAVLAPSILKEIPVDPITGNAFEYSKKGNTFTLSCAWFKEKEEQKKKKKK